MSTALAPRSRAGFRVAVLGGGYAALAAVISIRSKAPAAHITLISPRKAHIKTTRLHESLRHSLRHCCVPYSDLARRFELRFLQGKLRFDPESLLRWEERRYLQVAGEQVSFDFLILATGARSAPQPPNSSLFTLDDFFLNRAQTALFRMLESSGRRLELSVVGGGATGIQFLFELSNLLRRKAPGRTRLRLVTLESRLLTQFPPAFHKHAAARLAEENIDWLPTTEFLGQEGSSILARPAGTQEPGRLPSDITFLFSGVRPAPLNIATNAFGQVLFNEQALQHVFASGDCARYPKPGADALSAQVAVRKGKLAAINVVSAAHGGEFIPYRYREQGYIVSLGPKDAFGWVGSKNRFVRGLPAVTMKAAIERQYDLFLAGVDTYQA